MAPQAREGPFGLDGLLFSRTDRKGHILFGDDVFSRGAGHPRAEMVGRPHRQVVTLSSTG